MPPKVRQGIRSECSRNLSACHTKADKQRLPEQWLLVKIRVAVTSWGVLASRSWGDVTPKYSHTGDSARGNLKKKKGREKAETGTAAEAAE
jgi:hypothetical protein